MKNILKKKKVTQLKMIKKWDSSLLPTYGMMKKILIPMKVMMILDSMHPNKLKKFHLRKKLSNRKLMSRKM